MARERVISLGEATSARSERRRVLSLCSLNIIDFVINEFSASCANTFRVSDEILAQSWAWNKKRR